VGGQCHKTTKTKNCSFTQDISGQLTESQQDKCSRFSKGDLKKIHEKWQEIDFYRGMGLD